MFLTKRSLARRTFLRGAGASLALPLLVVFVFANRWIVAGVRVSGLKG